MKDIELFNDNFQNWKRYQIPKAQLIIADVPYNLAANAYASNPAWYVDGDNKNGGKRQSREVVLRHRQGLSTGRVHALLFTVSCERTERKGKISLHDYFLRGLKTNSAT